MTSATSRRYCWRDWVALALLLGLALWLRLEARDVWTHDLKPRPDALEYTAVAERVVHDGSFSLRIDGQEIPSRYPPGMALFLGLGSIAGFAPWQSYVPVLAAGLLTVSMLFVFARRLLGLGGAVLATLTLVVSPAHVHFSVLAMSEVPSTLAVLAVAVVGLKLFEGVGSGSRAFSAGLLAGLSPLLRYPNFLIGMALLALLAGGRRSRALLWCAGGATVSLAVLALYNQWMFGAFWQSGYRLWEPDDYGRLADHLSLTFLFRPAEEIWEGGNLSFYLPVITGLNRAVLNPLVALLAVVGAITGLHRRIPAVGLSLVFCVITVLFYSAYFFRAERLMVVLVPFAGLLAGLGLETVLARVRSAPATRAAAMAALAMIGCLAYGVDGLRRGKGETLQELYVHRFGSMADAVLPRLGKTLEELPEDAVLVVDLPRLLLELTRTKPRTTFNLAEVSSDRHTHWAWKHDLHDLQGRPFRPRVLLHHNGEVDAAVLAEITAALEAGRRAFLLYSPRSSVFQQAATREALRGVFRLEAASVEPGFSVLEVALRQQP